MTIDEEVVAKLRKRYKNIHQLIFHRSLERAETPGDLFDILDSFPDKYPLVWDDDERHWVATEDISQVGRFNLLRKKEENEENEENEDG
jgi:hypothetical protein